MSWFNYYGLAIMAIILIPNIIYAIKHKNDVAPTYTNKKIVIAEQIGRYGCFILMIFNIPYTYFNFWFDSALIVYLSVNGSLCLAYLIFVCFKPYLYKLQKCYAKKQSQKKTNERRQNKGCVLIVIRYTFICTCCHWDFIRFRYGKRRIPTELNF